MNVNVGPSRNSARPGGSSRRGRRPGQAKGDLSTTGLLGGRGSRTRQLVTPFVFANVIIITICVAVSLASLLFTSTTLVALPGTIAQTYVVLNAGAISGSGQVVSAVPLLPAACVWALIARTTFNLVRYKASIRDLEIIAAVAVLLPLALTLTAAAMLWSASQVFEMGIPPAVTYVRVVMLHGSAVAVGMGPRLWKALACRFGVPEAWVSAAYTALKLTGLWLGAGLVLVIAMTVVRWQPVGYPLVAAGFLPNAAIAGGAVLLGSDFRVGDAWVSAFSANPGLLPPVQWLVAMPETVHPAAALLLMVAFVIAVYALFSSPEYGLAVAPFAAVWAGLLQLWSAGTVGVLGYVGPTWWLTMVMAFVYPAAIGLGAVIVRLVTGKKSLWGEAVSDDDTGTEKPEENSEYTADSQEAESSNAEAPVVEENASDQDEASDSADIASPAPADGELDDAEGSGAEGIGAEEKQAPEVNGAEVELSGDVDGESHPESSELSHEGPISAESAAESSEPGSNGEEGDAEKRKGGIDSDPQVSTANLPQGGRESSDIGGDGGEWGEQTANFETKVVTDDGTEASHPADDPQRPRPSTSGENDASGQTDHDSGSRLWNGNTAPSSHRSEQ